MKKYIFLISFFLSVNSLTAQSIDSVIVSDPIACVGGQAEVTVFVNSSINFNFLVQVQLPGGNFIPMGVPTTINVPPSTFTVGNLLAGTYQIVLIDIASGNNLDTSDFLIINQPPAIQLFFFQSENISCFGFDDGTIDLWIGGGTSPYTYAWSNGLPNDSFVSGLSPGTYTCTVTDFEGCTFSGNPITQSITEPSALAATSVVTDVDCFGNATGEIDITVTDGTGPYNYLWVASNGGSLGVNPANFEDLTSLIAGDYTCTITDANGCQLVHTKTVTEPAATLAATSVVTDVLCTGEATGEIDITVTDGTAGYTYSWVASNGGSLGGNPANFEDLTSLIAGDYTCTITDANGCQLVHTKTVTEPAATLAATSVVTDVLCTGEATGEIDITVTDGTGPYNYLWVASNGGSLGVNPANFEDLTSLIAGDYTCTITDANGCQETHTKTITEPAALAATSVVTDVDCFGNATGEIDITVTDGTGPYNYLWVASNGGSLGVNPANFEDLTSLIAGDYTCTITDANGCQLVHTKTVTEPAATLAATSVVTDVLCTGEATGEIDITVTDGTAGYTYSWVASNGGSLGGNPANFEDLTSLIAGDYTCTITDANGCQLVHTKTVTEPAATLAATSVVTDVLCTGEATGEIDITVTDGTAGYTYSWVASNGGSLGGNPANFEDLTSLIAGDYTCTITDANGCQLVHTKTVTEPAATLAATSVVTDVLCTGEATGEIDITVTDGTGPYNYLWVASNGGSLGVNPANFEDLTSLIAGDYTCTITDANGCQETHTKTITEPAAL